MTVCPVSALAQTFQNLPPPKITQRDCLEIDRFPTPRSWLMSRARGGALNGGKIHPRQLANATGRSAVARGPWPSRVQVDVLDAGGGVLVPGLVGPAEHRGGVAFPAGRHLDQGQLLHGRICSSRALRLIAATSIACQNILPAFHVRTLRQHSDPVQGQISPLLPERDMGLACTRQPAWQRRPGTGRIPRRHTSVSVPRLRTSRTHSPAC